MKYKNNPVVLLLKSMANLYLFYKIAQYDE